MFCRWIYQIHHKFMHKYVFDEWSLILIRICWPEAIKSIKMKVSESYFYLCWNRLEQWHYFVFVLSIIRPSWSRMTQTKFFLAPSKTKWNKVVNISQTQTKNHINQKVSLDFSFCYDSHNTHISAFNGQQFLFSTLSLSLSTLSAAQNNS